MLQLKYYYKRTKYYIVFLLNSVLKENSDSFDHLGYILIQNFLNS